MEFQEKAVKPPNSESWDVFQEDESRSALANEPEKFKYKSTSLSLQASSSACNADILAGESATDDVHTWEVVCGQCLHIVPNGSLVKVTRPHSGQ